MKSIELFAGIGGIALAAEWAGIEAIAFCEIDPFCQKILKKHWPHVPIFDDIRKLNRQVLEEHGVIEKDGTVDIISGGFPCQPYSIAGKRRGKEDDRDLWPEMFRIIQELKPTWVVGENVANFANMELERSLTDLESEGYETQAFIIPACAVNANHRRDRCFIVAYSDSKRRQEYNVAKKPGEKEFSSWNDFKKVLRHTNSQPKSKADQGIKPVRSGREARGTIAKEYRGVPSGKHWETNQPAVCRVDDGLSNRLDKDRLKALGNAVVPQQIYPIFQAIMQIERGMKHD